MTWILVLLLAESWVPHGSVSVVDSAFGLVGPWWNLDNDPQRRPQSSLTASDSSLGSFEGDFTLDVSFALRSIGEVWSAYHGSPRIVAKPGDPTFYEASFYVQLEGRGALGNLLVAGFFHGKGWDEVRMGDEVGEPVVEVGVPYRVVVQYASACSSLTMWVFRLPEPEPFFAQRVWRVRRPKATSLPVHVGYGGPGSTDSWFDGYIGRLSLLGEAVPLPFASSLPLAPRPPLLLPAQAARNRGGGVEVWWPEGWGTRFLVEYAPSPQGPWEAVECLGTGWEHPGGSACYRVVPLDPPDTALAPSSVLCPPRRRPKVKLHQRFPESCAFRVDAGVAHWSLYHAPSPTGPWTLVGHRAGGGPWVSWREPRDGWVVVRERGNGVWGPPSQPMRLPPAQARSVARWAQIPVTVAIFRRGPPDSIPLARVPRLVRGIELACLFTWRNSGCRLNLDPRFLVIDRMLGEADYARDGFLWPGFVESLLLEAGFMPDEGGLVFALFPPLAGGGNFGGMTIFDDVGYSFVTYPPRTNVVYPGDDPGIDYAITWLFTHELQHSIDLVAYERSGCEAMWHGDKPLDCAIREGQEFSYQAGILRHFADYLGLQAPWGEVLESWDDDGDGIPDADGRVWLDEERFGSSPARQDTDGDGLADLRELMAGIYHGSNPRHPDTDGDGLLDGVDPLPLSSLVTSVRSMPVEVDGVLDPGWEPAGRHLSWTSRRDFRVSTHLAWTEAGLAVGLALSEPTKVVIELDLGFDGWWHGRDNVLLVWQPEDSLRVRVMDATPEARAFRASQVGFAVEAWDDDEAYQAAFGRLLDGERVLRAARRTPRGMELEVFVPAEPKMGFRPSAQDTVGVAIHFPSIPATLLERYELAPFVLQPGTP